MKKIIYFIIILLVSACSSDKEDIKHIIDNSYFGMHKMKKMEDIKKLKENIYSLPVYYSFLEKYVEAYPDNDYRITRYIYKTEKGAYRMFYLIDVTNKKVLLKSNDVKDFFEPLAIEILGERVGDLEGNNLMDIMAY
ncbi:hypothetical protein [Lacinutrix sp. Hel_I_90]|uniref:hypothetical protein n=1 Tax=Lacinutrix sp. Hel_I_90 TaxID=1249999 RepID=UPI0005C859D8|nr:hypothetical protein [Lacinutrix sp. Hel_I_90]